MSNHFGTTVYLSFTVFLILSAATTSSGAIELVHDQGKQAGSVYLPGNYGHAVSFSPPSIPWRIKGVRIYGARFGQSDHSEFTLAIWGTNRSVLSSPYVYSRFQMEPTWVDIEISDFEVIGDFFVVIYTESSSERGIRIGFDSSLQNKHSEIALGRQIVLDWAQINWNSFSPIQLKKEITNWMIRVVGSAPMTLDSVPPWFSSFFDQRLLQVAGAIGTGGSIIVGWLFRSRKRRYVSGYLRKIDSVCQGYSRSAEERVKSLVQMKDEVHRMLENGRIDESQYAVLDSKLTTYLKELSPGGPRVLETKKDSRKRPRVLEIGRSGRPSGEPRLNLDGKEKRKQSQP